MGGTYDRYFWTVAVGLALIIVGTLYGSGRQGTAPTAPAAAAPAPVPDIVRPFSERSPASSVHARFIASVYECRRGGERVFSDERCGSDARLRTIRDPSHMDAQDTTILSVPVSWTVRSQAAEAAPVPDSGACASIEREQQAINARMREGYAAGEGEILRARLRKLSGEFYGLRCRHFH